MIFLIMVYCSPPSFIGEDRVDVAMVAFLYRISEQAPKDLVYTQSELLGYTGVSISNLNPTVSGIVEYYTISPSLPEGLSFSNTTGVISGTPSSASSRTEYIISAINGIGSASFSIWIEVQKTITPIAFAYNLSSYSFYMNYSVGTITPSVSSGSVSSYSVSPSLPAGLNLDTNTGAISGTPTSAQTASVYTITGSNSDTSYYFSLSITVSTGSPGINYTNTSYYFTLNTKESLVAGLSGLSPTSCTISPTLPSGLNIDNYNCSISGTPIVAEPLKDYTVTVTNGQGSATIGLKIGIKICYTWGCFIDNGDGTVSFSGIGIASSYDYSGKSFTFLKCTQGQTYNSSSNDCTGAGTAPLYNARQVQFCTSNSDDCNNRDKTQLLGSGFWGTESSSAYTDCNGVSFAGKTGWRVPSHEELKATFHCIDLSMPSDLSSCATGSSAPTINSFFPNTVSGAYWSSTSYSGDSQNAYVLYYDIGIDSYALKNTSTFYVRCVTGP
ncbi:MAG: putative Ig domain-containing protein [Leptospiraceae bacterium]|nr:putative Ig domain-containing protein [Leptospiraceae bacterium]MCP5499168.1 putative Ig domain-containing protein [Leptospiraceae bacterium]